jgi:uncharacterized SAM-binding protein YcdF (DUF218 family)
MTELSHSVTSIRRGGTRISRGGTRGRVIAAIGSVTLAVACIAVAGPTLLEVAGRTWVVSDRLGQADAAVVLGGGLESRPAAAAKLFADGNVARILVSTAETHDLAGHYQGDIDRQILIKLGVPATAITQFGDHPSSTYEEARALALWAEQNRLQRVIIPTEAFSSRRVRWIFRRELTRIGVDARVETLTPRFYRVDDWWTSRSGLTGFAGEFVKYLYYRVRYWRS